jgi:hypothetical protein
MPSMLLGRAQGQNDDGILGSGCPKFRPGTLHPSNLHSYLLCVSTPEGGSSRQSSSGTRCRSHLHWPFYVQLLDLTVAGQNVMVFPHFANGCGLAVTDTVDYEETP